MSIGVAILSWKSPKTVRNTLESYLNTKFLDMVDDSVLCFQEVSKEDIELAKSVGIRYVATDNNKGIQGAFRLGYESLDTDYILILENDCSIVGSQDFIRSQLTEALKLLDADVVDLVRLRSRFNPGFGGDRAVRMYTRFFNVTKPHENFNLHESIDNSLSFIKWMRRTLRPDKACRWSGRSVYVEKHPEKLFPKFISAYENALIVDSHILPWTNQPTLVSRKFFGSLLEFADKNPSRRTVNAFLDLEKPLNCKWWRNSKFRIGIIDGMFTHNRLDR